MKEIQGKSILVRVSARFELCVVDFSQQDSLFTDPLFSHCRSSSAREKA